MRACAESAYAKLNLTLDILGRRPDGYHEMRMVMQSVSLCDHLQIQTCSGSGEIRVTTDKSYLPGGEKNLAGKAARLLLERLERRDLDVSIQIEKQIPVGAGLGGGSADAAAVLRGLNALLDCPLTLAELEELGAEAGSDVPFCVRGGTVLAGGRGEKMQTLAPLPPCGLVLCKPDFSVSTAELFALADTRGVTAHPDTGGMLDALRAGDLAGISHRLYNVFEEITQRGAEEIREIRGSLYDCGALGTVMSGTGPTVFGIFHSEAAAEAAAAGLRSRWRECFSAHPVGPC